MDTYNCAVGKGRGMISSKASLDIFLSPLIQNPTAAWLYPKYSANSRMEVLPRFRVCIFLHSANAFSRTLAVLSVFILSIL